MAIISFSHVSKHYPGDIKALSDVSVSVNEGDMVFLAGPSGAGKSTLLKLIAGIERPSGGVLIVSGQDMRKLNRTTLPFLRRKLGLILQQHRLLKKKWTNKRKQYWMKLIKKQIKFWSMQKQNRIRN